MQPVGRVLDRVVRIRERQELGRAAGSGGRSGRPRRPRRAASGSCARSPARRRGPEVEEADDGRDSARSPATARSAPAAESANPEPAGRGPRGGGRPYGSLVTRHWPVGRQSGTSRPVGEELVHGAAHARAAREAVVVEDDRPAWEQARVDELEAVAHGLVDVNVDVRPGQAARCRPARGSRGCTPSWTRAKGKGASARARPRPRSSPKSPSWKRSTPGRGLRHAREAVHQVQGPVRARLPHGGRLQQGRAAAEDPALQ